MSDEPLIIVAGFLRTGTSAMMQCLRENRFYIGEPGQLRGGYGLCEHIGFSVLNNEILGHNGATRNNYMWVKRPPKLEFRNEAPLHFIEDLKREGIQALKHFGLVADFWLRYPEFKNAKYILTYRDKRNIAESLCMRKREVNIQNALAIYEEYEKYMLDLQDCNHIDVEYEALMDNDPVLLKGLAEFLGLEMFHVKPLNPTKWHFKPDQSFYGYKNAAN